MAHEKEKAQYEEDCKNHERPWELWEISHDGREWSTCTCTPSWGQWGGYRRKEPPFTPEYFSGLNWREAEKLIGKVVEFSNTGNYWTERTLVRLLGGIDNVYKFVSKDDLKSIYIRTTPDTHKHPTITIGRVELPRPETTPLVIGQEYFYFDPANTSMCTRSVWSDGFVDHLRLNNKCIHLTESRAQAWADWWQDTRAQAWADWWKNTAIEAVTG